MEYHLTNNFDDAFGKFSYDDNFGKLEMKISGNGNIETKDHLDLHN